MELSWYLPLFSNLSFSKQKSCLLVFGCKGLIWENDPKGSFEGMGQKWPYPCFRILRPAPEKSKIISWLDISQHILIPQVKGWPDAVAVCLVNPPHRYFSWKISYEEAYHPIPGSDFLDLPDPNFICWHSFKAIILGEKMFILPGGPAVAVCLVNPPHRLRTFSTHPPS